MDQQKSGRTHPAETPSLRPLALGDEGVLCQATLGNMNWCGARFSLEDVLSDPRTAHYTVFHPERGDFGCVMTGASGVMGVAWAQFLGCTDPGYGFVADDVPELSLWMLPRYRGAGHGRALLRAALVEGEARGHRRVSLSVEDGNPARRLYESEGFVAVAGRERDGVMLRTAR